MLSILSDSQINFDNNDFLQRAKYRSYKYWYSVWLSENEQEKNEGSTYLYSNTMNNTRTYAHFIFSSYIALLLFYCYLYSLKISLFTHSPALFDFSTLFRRNSPLTTPFVKTRFRTERARTRASWSETPLSSLAFVLHL